MVKADSKPVSEKELEAESDIEEVIEKDGAGYGDLQSLNAQPDQINRDAETYVGKPAPKESETYIQERKSYSMGMTDQNKLKNTKLGDHINYYENGVAGNGVVSKMSGQFIQIFKDDGKFYNININDTFHVSDILINKTWDAMNLEERTDQLLKIKAYSPRFLSKTWDQLPRELQDVMKDTDHDEKASKKEQTHYFSDDDESNPFSIGNEEPPKSKRIPKKVKITKAEWDAMKATGEPDKQHTSHNSESTPQLGGVEDDYEHGEPYKEPKHNSYDPEHNDLEYTKHSSIEDGALGNTGSSPTTGVSTKIPFDAPKDYEGQTHATKNPDREFQYEDEKPEVGKEKPAPEVKLDEQGLVKANPSFVYSDNPQGYKLPPQTKQKGYGMRYGVKYINEEEDN